MSAVVEALLWILMVAQSSAPGPFSDLLDKPLLIVTESRYALGICNGSITPKENLLLAILMKICMITFGLF